VKHRSIVLLLCVIALSVACRRTRTTPPTPIGPPPVAQSPSRAVAPPPPPPPPSESLSAPPTAITDTVALTAFATGFERPVALLAAPGDARRRLFVVEQPGRIRTIDHGHPSATAFLDVSALVSSENEQGLLGLAFHPGFAKNRRLFIDYTDQDGDTHVVEYRVSASDPDRVDPSSARELLRIEQPYSNHNGGDLVFGPDGWLWIGTGDGGAAGDPRGNGQNPDALLGKMLRLDPDAAAPTPKVAAIGLRNPWRYSFDAATGDLYIGDVGQNQWEQLYVVPADHRDGHNFGWNVAEGRHCYDADRCDRSAFTAPVTDYPHSDGCSVTGGVVYRGASLPELVGVYFYADFCTAFVRSFRWSPDGIRDHWDWKAALDPHQTLAQISSFGVDADGEMYLVLLGGDILLLSHR
jgi:glucose/arabinose dehydrogenase